MAQHRRFDDCDEWKAIGHHSLVRFRPREKPTSETSKVTLSVARKAVDGKLASALGDAYACCAALVGLRLGPGSKDGQLDLMLLGRSGAVALGECKLLRTKSRGSAVQRASQQLEGYERVTRGQDAAWLRNRIEDSYARFGFPSLSELVTTIGVEAEEEQVRWWSVVADNIQRGNFGMFIATRSRGESVINLYRCSSGSSDQEPFCLHTESE